MDFECVCILARKSELCAKKGKRGMGAEMGGKGGGD